MWWERAWFPVDVAFNKAIEERGSDISWRCPRSRGSEFEVHGVATMAVQKE